MLDTGPVSQSNLSPLIGVVPIDRIPFSQPDTRMWVGNGEPFTADIGQEVNKRFEGLDGDLREEISRHRSELSEIVHGNSDKIGLIVGPCSIHNFEEAEQYVQELAGIKVKLDEMGLGDMVEIIVRLYPEKPRSKMWENNRLSWRGPLASETDPAEILIEDQAERFEQLMATAYRAGFGVASEYLNRKTVARLAHMNSMVAVGARTVDDPNFQQMAMGLTDIPIGFKNHTSGNVDMAVQACRNVEESNTHGFVVLRGGESGTNWDAVSREQSQYLSGKRVCVDVCHSNSGKILDKTREITACLCQDISMGICPPGVIMLESNLVEGKQNYPPAPGCELTPGQSITDPCIDIEETERMIISIAHANWMRLHGGNLNGQFNYK